MTWIAIVVGLILVVACVAWFMTARRHPENAAGHAGDRPYVDASGHGASSTGVLDRPAGPDAERMTTDPPEPSSRPDRPPRAGD